MDVVLAVMPFASVRRPCLGVSLLQAVLRARGFACAVEYLDLDYASRIGYETYELLADAFPTEQLVGEWVFSSALHATTAEAERAFVDEVLGISGCDAAATARLLGVVRRISGDFVDHCARRIARHGAAVVGFTTAFQQTC